MSEIMHIHTVASYYSITLLLYYSVTHPSDGGQPSSCFSLGTHTLPIVLFQVLDLATVLGPQGYTSGTRGTVVAAGDFVSGVTPGRGA